LTIWYDKGDSDVDDNVEVYFKDDDDDDDHDVYDDEGDDDYDHFNEQLIRCLIFSHFSFLFAVTGNFLSPSTPINISMAENEPFLLRCPPREYSSQVDFDWDAPAIRGSIANNLLYAPRILMEPNGDLLFSYVERSDFTTFISQGQSWNPIRCRTSNRYSQSATGPPVYFYIPSSGKRYTQRWKPRFLPYTFYGMP